MPESPSPSTPVGSSAPTPAPAAPVPQRIRQYRRLWCIAFATLALDQATKFLVIGTLPFGSFGERGGGVTVIPGFFYLAHVGNTGAAWSMFSGASVLLASLAAATLVAIFYWRHALGLRDGVAQLAFGLLCGGIAGNLVDRLLHHHVVDFIDLRFGSYIYPTFNVADCGICVGVILYLWRSLRSPEDSGK